MNYPEIDTKAYDDFRDKLLAEVEIRRKLGGGQNMKIVLPGDFSTMVPKEIPMTLEQGPTYCRFYFSDKVKDFDFYIFNELLEFKNDNEE